MNTTEQLLTQHLQAIADQAEPIPDLDSVLGESMSDRDRGRASASPLDRRRRRLLVPTVAAALVVVATVGVAWILSQRAPATGVSSSPTSGSVIPTVPPSTMAGATVARTSGPGDEVPTAFPVIDTPPDGLSVTASAEQNPIDSDYSEVLIGRQVDGSLIDAVRVSVQADEYTPSAVEGKPPTPATVMGEPAMVYAIPTGPDRPDSTFVIWGDGPYFDASGADPLAFLSRLAPGTITAVPSSDTGDPVTIEVGALPSGHEVVVPSRPRAERLSAGLQVGEDNFEILVSSRNPVLDMATVIGQFDDGVQLRSIEVNSKPGWMFAPPEDAADTTYSTDLAWQENDSTYVYVAVTDGSNIDRVLEFAKSIRFVDFDTWVDRYDVAVAVTSGTEPSATTEQPASDIATSVVRELWTGGEPDRFPVVADPSNGMQVSAYETSRAPATPFIETLVGRETDGVISDAVRFAVQPEPIVIEPGPGTKPTAVTVLGEPATVYDMTSSNDGPDAANRIVVTWGTGPYFVAEGEDPLALLNVLQPGSVELAGVDGTETAPALVVDLPDGIETIAPSQSVSDAPNRAISIGAGHEQPETFNVTVDFANPVATMAVNGRTERVDVDGHLGWTSVSPEGTRDLTWQVDNVTHAYLTMISGGSVDEVIELARMVTFVDLDSWWQRYQPSRLGGTFSQPVVQPAE